MLNSTSFSSFIQLRNFLLIIRFELTPSSIESISNSQAEFSEKITFPESIVIFIILSVFMLDSFFTSEKSDLEILNDHFLFLISRFFLRLTLFISLD